MANPKALWPDILRLRRRERGYPTQEALAAASLRLVENPDDALTQRVVSYVETGRTNPLNLGGIRLLVYLQLLGWSPQEFSEHTGLMPHWDMPTNAIPVEAVRLPIVNAGAGVPAWNDSDEWIILDLPILKTFSRNDLFAIRVWGDSMVPTFTGEDILIFAKSAAAEHGKVVAVLDMDGLIVKRLIKENGAMWLASDNHNHPPQRLRSDQRIYGVFKAMLRTAG